MVTTFATAAPYTIQQDHYFMMGDCRDNSLDSRFWGTVSKDSIIGKAIVLIDSADPTRQQTLPRRLDQ